MPPRPAPALPASFIRLSFSNLAAQVSEQIALAAAPLVAVLVLGMGAAATGYLQTAQTLPFLLLSLPAGVLADRVSRHRLMAGAEALRTLALCAILALLLFGGMSLPALAALGFIGTVGTVVYTVTAPALVPTLVARDVLAHANRWLELGRSAAFAAGPALGGALVGLIGAPIAYAGATLLSLIAVRLLAGLPPSPVATRAHRHIMQELKEGASYAIGHPLLRPILVTAIFFNTAWFILQAIYVAYAVQHLGLTAGEVGMTLGTYGAGMITAAALAPGLSRHVSFGAVVASGPASALAASVLMLLSWSWPSGWLAACSFFLFGAGPTLWTIATTTLRQSITPGPLLGRVSAVIVTATFGARPIGAAIGATLAAGLGVEACLWASTAAFAVQFLILFASPVRRLARLPEPA
ncbi:MAG TPA: MFS transporter [Roseomonas sp.]